MIRMYPTRGRLYYLPCFRTDYITWYHLRSYDRINGAQSVINDIQTKSGVTFDQAQVALDRLWLGNADPKWFQQGSTY